MCNFPGHRRINVSNLLPDKFFPRLQKLFSGTVCQSYPPVKIQDEDTHRGVFHQKIEQMFLFLQLQLFILKLLYHPVEQFYYLVGIILSHRPQTAAQILFFNEVYTPYDSIDGLYLPVVEKDKANACNHQNRNSQCRQCCCKYQGIHYSGSLFDSVLLHPAI